MMAGGRAGGRVGGRGCWAALRLEVGSPSSPEPLPAYVIPKTQRHLARSTPSAPSPRLHPPARGSVRAGLPSSHPAAATDGAEQVETPR